MNFMFLSYLSACAAQVDKGVFRRQWFCSPDLQRPLWYNLQATKRFINCSSLYFEGLEPELVM